MLVSMGEVEDERGAVLELNEQALLQGEVPAIDNAHYLHQGPILLDRLILGQYKGGKLEMRILLKGGDIPKPTYHNNYFSFSCSIDRYPFLFELFFIQST